MYYFPNMIGGTEHSTKLLAENMVLAGNEVHVLTMDGKPNSNILKAECINGVWIHRSYSLNIYRRRIERDRSHHVDPLMNGFHSIFNPRMNKDIKTLIKFIHPEVIHTQNLVSMSYWIWKYAKKIDIPVVHTLRDYWLINPTTTLKENPTIAERCFIAYHKTLSNKYVNVVTAPSNKVLQIFKTYGYFYNKPAKCIVNAINFDEKKLLDALGEKNKRIYQNVNFIYVGTLAETKGIKVLCKAFKEAKVNGTLSICGDGNLETWIKAQNIDNIKLLGKLNSNELAEEYQKADVLIVPSLWEEPFGRIVIEGAQYGLPTIGSNKGGIPETITTLKYGVIYDAEDVLMLKKCIQQFSDRKYLKTFYNNPPTNLSEYGINLQIERFIEIYNHLIDHIS